jgi:hypothetical protein
VPDASPELDEWLDRERTRLRSQAAEAAWRVARGAARRKEPGLAARWSRWAASLTPLDEPAQRQLIELLVGLGDRTGALAVYQQLVDRLARELGTTPTAATRTLAESLRLRVSGPAAGNLAPHLVPTGETQATPAPPPSAAAVDQRPTPAAHGVSEGRVKLLIGVAGGDDRMGWVLQGMRLLVGLGSRRLRGSLLDE